MFTAEKKAALNLPPSFPEGWWIGMKYHDEDVWQDIKAGKRKGFSIHGSGHRVPVGKSHDVEKTVGVSAMVIANRRSLGSVGGRLLRKSHAGRLLADDFAAARGSARTASREAGTAVRATRNVARDLRLSSQPRGPLTPTLVHGDGPTEVANPIRRRVAVTAGGGVLVAHSDRRS